MEKFIPEIRIGSVHHDPFTGPEIERCFPTTESQREVITSSEMGDDASCAYNESITLELNGDLDRSLMQTVLHQLVMRHDSLRATVTSNGMQMIVGKEDPTSFEFVDLASLGTEEQQRKLKAIDDADMTRTFDLHKGPLFRHLLIRTAADKHLLRLSAHHAVCDGWSLGIMMAEISALYNADKSGTTANLPEAPSFGDYSVAAADFTDQPEHAAVENYWLDLFSAPLPRLDLPTDRPRPKQKTYAANRLDLAFPPELVRGLKETATRNGATFVTTLLTIFEVLLHKLTGDNDLVVGLPAAGQSDTGQQHLVGHCVNLLALRSRIDGETRFSEHLKKRRTAVLDAYDNQRYTFGTLVHKLRVPREPGRIPLCPVVFNVDMNMDDGVAFNGLAHRFTSNPRAFENFELFLNMTGNEDHLILEWSYNKDLFDEASVHDWMEQLARIAKGVIAAPTATIAELADNELPSDGEVNYPPTEWAGKATPYPRSDIATLFDEVAKTYPESIAVELLDERVTYSELQKRVHAASNGLVALGVRPGEPVGLCMDRTIDLIVATLAVLRAGGCYVPIDPSYPADRLGFMLTDTNMKILLTQSDLADSLPPHGAKAVLMKDLPAAPQDMPATLPDAPGYIMYTSGSTGKPKGVVVPHRGIIRLVRNQDYMTFGPDLAFLHLSNISFDLSTLEIWGALLNGGRLVLQPQAKPTLQEISDTIKRHKVTSLWFTVGLFNLMVDDQLEGLLGLRHILAGGDVLSVPHVKKALRALGPGVLINGYGPTENTTFTTCFKIDKEADITDSVPIGPALNNTTVYVLDENLKPVPIGQKGELYTGGDGVALGYWNRDDLTAERFIDDPWSTVPGAKLYRTGDIVRWHPDGNIAFIGRADGQVKVRGFRVELGEVENALNDMDRVKDKVVVARQDGPVEKQLVCYIVPKDAKDLESEETTDRFIHDVREHLRGKMPGYMVPTAFVALEALPLTANAKIDRKALPAPSTRVAIVKEKHVEPRTDREKKLAVIWGAVLNIEGIGIHDNFFDIGGHSLIAIQLMQRVETQFGEALPLKVIFQAPTIAQFAELLHSGAAVAVNEHLSLVQPLGDRLPFFCVNGDEANYFLPKYMGNDMPFYAFFHQGEDGLPMRYTSVETIAARFIQEMKNVRPRGPYLLGGYSFGGIVAYEMACQLMEAGDEVPMLALFDTYAPTLYLELTKEEQRVYDPLKRVIMRRLVKLEQRRGRITNPKLRHFHIIDTYDRAVMAYTPKPYKGRLTMFKASGSPGADEMGWSALALGGLDVQHVPGDHYSMILEPQVAVLAQRLAERTAHVPRPMVEAFS
ncbi:MAG: amino acid adenylation domain-containing protein [Flavobacteriales bacterium]|nr:amino acid adenylation domain-containing protein [Flavobacteriales bacterium]